MFKKQFKEDGGTDVFSIYISNSRSPPEPINDTTLMERNYQVP